MIFKLSILSLTLCVVVIKIFLFINKARLLCLKQSPLMNYGK